MGMHRCVDVGTGLHHACVCTTLHCHHGSPLLNNALFGALHYNSGPVANFLGQCMCGGTGGTDCAACQAAVTRLQTTVLASPTCGTGSAWLNTCSVTTQVSVLHVTVWLPASTSGRLLVKLQ